MYVCVYYLVHYFIYNIYLLYYITQCWVWYWRNSDTHEITPRCGIDSAMILWVSLSGDASIQQWHPWYHYWSMRHPVNKIHNITVSKNIWLNCEKLKKYMGTTNKERELYGLFGAALLYVFQVHSMFLR